MSPDSPPSPITTVLSVVSMESVLLSVLTGESFSEITKIKKNCYLQKLNCCISILILVPIKQLNFANHITSYFEGCKLWYILMVHVKRKK
jgi:hypothetical protein